MISELRLLNEMMLDWHIHMKRQNAPPGNKYSYYKWETQLVKFFSFWVALKEVHGFQCELTDFCGFDGAVLDFLHRTVHRREEDWEIERPH